MLSPRPTNHQGQFLLPEIPANASPEITDLAARYSTACWATGDGCEKDWQRIAGEVHAFQPRSVADLAAKLIISLHFQDPEWEAEALAVDAPEPSVDRLAMEMILGCLDWLIAEAGRA